MQSSSSILFRHLLPLAIALLMGGAVAQHGFEVGLATYPSDGFVVDLHGVLPLFETGEVVHAARADVAYAFAGMPALALTYQLSGTAGEGDEIVRYLGAGAGVSFPEAPVASPLLSLHGLVGARLPLTDRFHAFLEASVAGNAVTSDLGLGLGVAYRFGGPE